MYTFLLILAILLAIGLCVIILLQAGKGGGLASTFGGTSSSTDSFMGGRQAATLLTKMTWVGGGVFLFLALVLSVLSSGNTDTTGESILRGQFQGGGQVPSAPRSILESGAGQGGGEEAAGGAGGPGGGFLESETGSGGSGEGSGGPEEPGGD